MYLAFTRLSYIYLLFLIPILVFFHFYNIRHIRSKSVKFANFEAMARIKGIDLYSKNIVTLILDILLVLSLVFSLAGLTLYMNIDSSKFSYVVAIDSSESMEAIDLSPNRFEIAKINSIEFINKLPRNSKIGFVTFSGNTKIEQEMTTNKELLKNAITNAKTTSFGGTDLLEAVTISSFLLKNEEYKSIILLSDGQINVGNMNEVVKIATDEGIVVYTFGVGTLGGGATKYGISKLDEDSLKSLAYHTSGEYFLVSNPDSMKSSFYKIVEVAKRLGPIDLSIYLIILAMGIFLLKNMLINIIGIYL